MYSVVAKPRGQVLSGPAGPSAMYQRLRAYCEHPRAPWAICIFAVLLASPALFVGLCGDDFIHGLILTGSREVTAYAGQPWTRLFEFASPSKNPALLADGILSWWTDPAFKLAFFRPLSALTHLLDYALWPKSALLMHAHNLAFFVLALVVVFRLYSQVLTPRWAAVLALFFYAVDPTRAITITWIANRNALIACALSSYAVLLHVRAIRDKRSPGWASPLCFGAGMLAGEGAIGAAAYLCAAELFFAQDTYRRRALRLLPYALIALGCLATARSLGYGVAGSGEYLDPLGDSAAYLHALPSRALALLGAELAFFNAEWWNAYDLLLPGSRKLFIIVASGALLFWAWAFAPLLRRSQSARFFCCGGLLALLPAAATFPNGRTLGWVSIGVMGLAAEYIASYALGPTGSRAQRAVSHLTAAFILLLHGMSGTLALPGGCWALHDVNVMLDRANSAVPRDASIRARSVMFVNAPQDPTVTFELPTRAFRGIPRPRAQRVLATGLSDLRITRIDAHTLEIEPRDGFVHEQTERVVRGARPFRLGERIALPGVEVEIMALTRDARPQRARFHFEHVLEDPSYLWLAWQNTGFVSFRPPPAGAISLPKVDFATMLLGAGHPVTQLLSRARAIQQTEP
jgi:hypothetical protein